MKKISLILLLLVLSGCQTYLDSDSRIFESTIARSLQLTSSDLITKCQHGALVSELNVNFINGECILTKDTFYFYVQEPTTLDKRLAHRINIRDIQSFGLIDASPSLRQDLKISQLQIRGSSFTYVNNMKADDAFYFAQSLRMSKIIEIQPMIKIMQHVDPSPTNINIIIPSKK